MAQQPAPGTCVYCLAENQDRVWNHVYPESWYASSPPSESADARAPVCRPCHDAHSENEEYLLARFPYLPDEPPVEDASPQLALLVGESSLSRLAEKLVRGITFLEEGRLITEAYRMTPAFYPESVRAHILAKFDRILIPHEKPQRVRIRRAPKPGDRVEAFFDVLLWERLAAQIWVAPNR